MENVPLPDILGDRKQQKSITVEEAYGLHPDLKAEADRGASIYRELVEVDEVMRSTGGSPDASLKDRASKAQTAICQQLDRLYCAMAEERDGVRIQVLTALYSDLLNPWKGILLQIEMTRAAYVEPRRPHERLMKEASLKLDKVVREKTG